MWIAIIFLFGLCLWVILSNRKQFNTLRGIVENVLESEKKVLENVKGIIELNERVLNQVPQARDNLSRSYRLANLCEEQQGHIARIRQDWIQANMLLNEALDIASMADVEAKLAEALELFRSTKGKYLDAFKKSAGGNKE